MTEISAPEWSHRVPLSQVGSRRREGRIDAEPAQAAALATRFDLPGITALGATYRLERRGEEVAATGQLSAQLEQACAVTGEAFPVAIDAPFDIRFIAVDDAPTPDEEIELDADDCDVMFHDGRAIDLGEAVAQTLFLALDPYPRGPGAAEAVAEQGLDRDEKTNPFAALTGLKAADKG